jgi:hypothetical protein
VDDERRRPVVTAAWREEDAKEARLISMRDVQSDE